jgi:hypothetical protein
MSELGKLRQRQNLETPATKWRGAEVKALTQKICLDGYKNQRIGNKLSQCEKMRECTNILGVLSLLLLWKTINVPLTVK